MYERQRYLIRKVLEKADILEVEGAWYVAGGALRSVFAGEQIEDLDIYFNDVDEYEKFSKQAIKEEDHPLHVETFDTPNAVSYKKNGVRIQLIKKIYGSPMDVMKQFDFTICMCAYVPFTNSFMMGESFLEHLTMRLLVFNVDAKYPINSMWRVQKYVSRGYRLPAVEMIKLALRVNDLHMENYMDLRDQLEGIDTLFLAEVTDALMEKKDMGYDFKEALAFINDKLNEKFEDIN